LNSARPDRRQQPIAEGTYPRLVIQRLKPRGGRGL